ncbi:hypothetical protein Ga0123461_0538 [Mariprofundus aestuarium]|uniref:Uncharacterized protein n=1 Tax=Mariprofundus aestuarium TaxID=1921086 RepID=A0A2K8L205_MARES|nr:hypothetical protein [Mariprofundus aestuarium]ATX78974.1 hypothetical protein Ga0123461_0538 [Mariprofundus aestuarium]
MKSIILLVSSLLLLSGSAIAQDYAATRGASKAGPTFSERSKVVEVTMRDNSRSSYKQSAAYYSHQNKFDDDAYLRRISYRP